MDAVTADTDERLVSSDVWSGWTAHATRAESIQAARGSDTVIVRCTACNHQGELRRSDEGWHCAACAALILEAEDSRPCDSESEDGKVL